MSSSEPFPQVDAEAELNPGTNRDFTVDSVSSAVAASQEIQKKNDAAERDEEEKKREKKEKALQNLKTAIMVSGIVVAVAGAAFAIVKKLRQK